MRTEPRTLIGLVPRVFHSVENQRQAELVAKPLTEGDSDLAAISDPDALPLEQAVKIASVLIQADAGFEVRLAQFALLLAPSEPHNGRQRRIRAIDILRRTLRSNRVMPIQVQLMGQDGPFVRSKAAQFIAELTNDASWFHVQLKDPDARVRANAMEALWNSEMPDAEGVFRQALLDSHHRVATTALVGWWRLGHRDECAERLLAMSQSEAAPTRAVIA